MIPGAVRRFPAAPGLLVPHIGWSGVAASPRAPLLSPLAGGARVYFVHSYRAVPEAERAPGFDTLPAGILNRVSDLACTDAAASLWIRGVCRSWRRDMPDRVFRPDVDVDVNTQYHNGYSLTVHGHTLMVTNKDSPSAKCNVFDLARHVCTHRSNKYGSETRLVSEDTLVTLSRASGIEWRSVTDAHPAIAVSIDRLRELVDRRVYYHDRSTFPLQFESRVAGIATWRASADEFLIVDARVGEGRIAILRQKVNHVVHVSSALIVLRFRVEWTGDYPSEFHIYSIDGTFVATLPKHHRFAFELPDGSLVFLAQGDRDFPNADDVPPDFDNDAWYRQNRRVTVSPNGAVRSQTIPAFGFDSALRSLIFGGHNEFEARVSPDRRYFACSSTRAHQRNRSHHSEVTVHRMSDLQEVAAYSFATAKCSVGVDDAGRVFAVPLYEPQVDDDGDELLDTRKVVVFAFPSHVR